jgi:hypothetical protein
MTWKRKTADLILAPMVRAAALPMRMFRSRGVEHLPRSREALRRAGVFPIVDHYYDPLIDTGGLKGLDQPRRLPGIDFRLEQQVALLENFEDVEGLADVPWESGDETQFSLNNPAFGEGDSDLWFHVVRHFKPRRIIEIGSGHSTLMARRAIERSRSLDPAYSCEHICIEPYEMPWLEKVATVIRKRVEEIDTAFFDSLAANDILFIDSSHMIRPQGDVLKEFLEIVPSLASGVIVHVHDIFTPRDYPAGWLRDKMLFWNEQYLLEAFLSFNSAFQVLLGANMLKHERYEALKAKCPSVTPTSEPGSFYFQRV